jgi:hypothetical protein
VKVSEKKMYQRLDASLWKTCSELIERAVRE